MMNNQVKCGPVVWCLIVQQTFQAFCYW